MGLAIFLRSWNDFATKTEFGLVLEYFCRIEIGLRIFFVQEKREEELDLQNFVQKERREKGSWT